MEKAARLERRLCICPFRSQCFDAFVRMFGMTYSRFINGLKKAGVDLDRKILSDLAVREPETFAGLVKQAQAAL